MSKARVVVGDMSGEESSSAPYSTRREKSRKLAQKRRDTYKQIMDDLTSVLPFPKEAVSQLDYNSRLRLALCFFRLKTMVDNSGEVTCGDVQTSADSGKQIVRKKLVSDEKPAMFQPGMLQDLMNEALDGFLMVTQVDGTIVFLSESIHKHMGLFQSEHIGVNMFELIHEEDHSEVRSKISDAEIKSLNQKGSAKVTFFCRMKCSRYKVANVITKSPGYKLVYISGTIKRARGEPFIACVVRPVSPPSVLEIRLEGNMFVCRYGADFTCTYFDGRLHSLLGYEKDDLVGKKPFHLFHHDDIEAIVKCRNRVFEKGESLSGYYRFFNAYGQRIWLQTRATLIIDSRTGKPVCVNCMFFVISKEQGDRDFQMRMAIKNSESSIKEENIHSHDPYPIIERSDGTVVNPLQDDKAQSSEVSTPSTSDSPSSSSVEVEDMPTTSSSDSSPGVSELPSGSSPSSFGDGQPSSRSSLQSESPVDSGTRNEMFHSYTHHGSSSSINSRGPSSGNSVFTEGSPPHDPISSMGDQPQSTSPDHQVNSCLPDSTTSNHPILYGDQPNGQNGVTVVSHNSNSDLGYRSGSSSSLSVKDRLTSPASYRSSPMKRTDSNTSSNISDASASCGAVHSSGVATSLPPHASSPAACMTSMSGGPEMHSQSLLHGVNGNGVCSASVSMSDASPTYQPQPVDQYSNDVRSYAGMCNQPVTSNAGFTIPMNESSQPFDDSAAGLNISVVQMNVGLNGGPQQFLLQSNVHGPVNGATGMDLADSLPDWIPAPTTTSSGGMAHQGVNGEPVLNFQTTAGPGFEFISSTIVGNVEGEEVYNPPPIISSASNMFVDSSVSGQSSNFSTSFQAPLRDSTVTYNGSHAASDLPQLTGEDLKILDAFDHMQGTGDQFGTFVYQQTPLNYNMTM